MIALKPKLELGPAEHGRRLCSAEFDAAQFQPGHRYELIRGRLYVSQEPDPAENALELWLFHHLWGYTRTRPDILDHVTNKPRVIVSPDPDATIPEPDLAAYADFPHSTRFEDRRWIDLTPGLVCEVLRGDPDKDLRRNLDLYFAVPSIREYWVLDGRSDAEQPALIQHRRYGKRWLVRSFPYGSTFTTKLLPGFSLLIDPRK